MKIKAYGCPKCGDYIYSRALHDFHPCKCKSLYIDGGFDYTRIVGDCNMNDVIEIDILPLESEKNIRIILYNDWNYGKNKYGHYTPNRELDKGDINGE